MREDTLSAACFFLLRFEATANQATTQLQRKLNFSDVIVGPTIINDIALSLVEGAPHAW